MQLMKLGAGVVTVEMEQERELTKKSYLMIQVMCHR